MSKTKIAIFASGTGTNALNIISHFKHHPGIEVAFVLSNKATSGILKSASEAGIETFHFENEQVENGIFISDFCNTHTVDFIVLAGYLRLIPEQLIKKYPERIFNIHPALLPKFGGTGMYGKYVHEAVLAQQEQETGITIHYVNQHFDSGRIIAQFHCALDKNDTLADIQRKVQLLEHAYFPIVIEKTILNQPHV